MGRRAAIASAPALVAARDRDLEALARAPRLRRGVASQHLSRVGAEGDLASRAKQIRARVGRADEPAREAVSARSSRTAPGLFDRDDVLGRRAIAGRAAHGVLFGCAAGADRRARCVLRWTALAPASTSSKRPVVSVPVVEHDARDLGRAIDARSRRTKAASAERPVAASSYAATSRSPMPHGHVTTSTAVATSSARPSPLISVHAAAASDAVTSALPPRTRARRDPEAAPHVVESGRTRPGNDSSGDRSNAVSARARLSRSGVDRAGDHAPARAELARRALR
jgi:hypothetical protein